MKKSLVIGCLPFYMVCLSLSSIRGAEDTQPPAQESAQVEEASKAKPPRPESIERQIGRIRGPLFDVEGETLADRQAAFRIKLKDALERVETMLENATASKDIQSLTKFQIELLRYGVLVKYENAKSDIETLFERLSGSDDPELLAIVKHEKLLYALDGFGDLPAEEQNRLMHAAAAHLTESEPTSDQLPQANAITRKIERAKNQELVATVHQQLADHFGQVEEEAFQKAASSYEASARRLSLPGKPLELTSTTMAGEPFDLTQLKGKVVLVDYWATWCVPCLAEIPELEQLYEEYQPLGFEIVGLSIDESHEHLEKFLEHRKIAWTILHDQSAEGQQGWSNPNLKRYGISAVPTMILVGRDGNVISTHARGEKLKEHLKEIFASPEDSASPEE